MREALRDAALGMAVAADIALARRRTGVAHLQMQTCAFAPATQRDLATVGQARDAVDHRILDQRLQDQTRQHQIARQVVGHVDADLQTFAEAQFLDPDIVGVATALATRGVRVILAGTDTDFRGEPFGAMGELMAVAEMVDKLQAICVVCGDPACRNQRLIDGRPARYDSPTIMVGGRESYEARCRHCHKVPRKDEDQTRLL